MRRGILLLLGPLVWGACGEMGNSDGARGRCAAGGQVLGQCDVVETPEDACWKLVDCGVLPLDNGGRNQFDWGGCVDRIESFDSDGQERAIACVGVASCDQLTVQGSPADPYPWPDCLEFPAP
jgi:hypothetical protein